jgi:hypothetical protein
MSLEDLDMFLEGMAPKNYMDIGHKKGKYAIAWVYDDDKEDIMYSKKTDGFKLDHWHNTWAGEDNDNPAGRIDLDTKEISIRNADMKEAKHMKSILLLDYPDYTVWYAPSVGFGRGMQRI